jgi:serine phosphatase RsbU (regulator of sigma subunit)
MDLGITIIDTKQKKIQYSGANNPLYIFRENGTGPELIEVKGDRMPIGIYRKQDIPFTNHEIDTESNDLIYMFTDGYVDQFGGEKGKKFKPVALKKLLLEINNNSLKEQEGILNNTIETWMEGHEQIDDILMMGIKLN